jgi:hypothetical protein
MPQIAIKTPFSFSDNGYTLVSHEAVGETVEVSEECARVALAEGWAVEPGKAEPAAPENKDAAPKRRTKA